jgi:hypothetical protein
VRPTNILVAGLILLSGGCAPLSPDEKLRWTLMEDVYWDAAHECAGRYYTVHLDRVNRDGDVQADTAAESQSETRQFTECYWEGIRHRVEARRAKGLPVPEPFNLQPTVDFD